MSPTCKINSDIPSAPSTEEAGMRLTLLLLRYVYLTSLEIMLLSAFLHPENIRNVSFILKELTAYIFTRNLEILHSTKTTKTRLKLSTTKFNASCENLTKLTWPYSVC